MWKSAQPCNLRLARGFDLCHFIFMKAFVGPGQHWHIAGVGGVGMNAIAQVTLHGGCRVTGSDRLRDQGKTTPVLDKLERLGLPLVPQDGLALDARTTGLVISSAIEDDNPEWVAAQRLNIPVWHRAAWLARLVRDEHVIAVAGTAGKTTVTGMLGWLLHAEGLKPNVVNGGAVLNWRTEQALGNVRLTGSDWWVLEVDESDRSLLQFKPRWAVITNISHDHFPLPETVDLFRRFAMQVNEGIVAPFAVQEMLNGAGPRWVTVADSLPLALPASLPGAHNQANARLALACCRALGLANGDEGAAGFDRFAGIERRLECVGRLNGAPVYDDYAHNPAKIAAACQAVAPPRGRLFAVWRPHGFGPLSALAPDLVVECAQWMRPTDHFIVLPVYYSGGTPGPSEWTVERFVSALQSAGVAARAVADFEALTPYLQKEVQTVDTVLSMGARDPQLPLFARQLTNTVRIQ